MYFQNRNHAGQELANALQKYKGGQTIILAIPRGGLPVAKEVAAHLQVPLDVILSKKIGHPDNAEFAIGAVSEEAAIVNPGFAVPLEFLNEQIEKIQSELARRRNIYLKDAGPLEVRDKIVIVIDDGAATGFTLLSTIKLIQRLGPKEIIIALPVASSQALEKLTNHPAVSEVICLYCPDDFIAVGSYYRDFEQLRDEDVIDILKESRSGS